MKYFTKIENISVESFCTLSYIDLPVDGGWLFSVTMEPTVNVGIRRDALNDVNIAACESDGIHISRRLTDGGAILSGSDCVTVCLRGSSTDPIQLCLAALYRLGITGERSGNDITIDRKKVAGFAPVVFDDVKAQIFIVNINTPLDLFGRYIIPDADRIEKHGEDYSETRVGKLTDTVPGLTTDDFIEALRIEFGQAEEFDITSVLESEEYQKVAEMMDSRAWRYYGLRPEEVYKMQEIKLANGQTFSADEVRGSAISGRECLTFVLPEGAGSLEEVKSIFANEAALETISVSYRNQTDEGEPLRQNVQTGFVVPVSLSHEAGKYLMTLGRRTQQERDYKDLQKQVEAQAAIAAFSVGVEVELTPETVNLATAAANVAEASEGGEWRSGVRVTAETQQSYKGVNYECIQTHVTLPNWTPDKTPALWRVKQAEPEPGQVLPWVAGEAVKTGDKRTYGGKTYACKQGHTTQTDWEPPKVPALWEVKT